MFPPHVGTNYDWGFNQDMHLTENSSYATNENRVKLFAGSLKYHSM